MRAQDTKRTRIGDVFSTSILASSKLSTRKDPSVGTRSVGYTNPDYPTRASEPLQEESETSNRQSTRSTFRWIKGELLGRGSHGRVYLGFNATTGEILAVKQVEIPTTPDDRRKEENNAFVQRLREERETLKDLYHPNIVQYLGFEENPKTVNIFLEYVSGGTLAGCLHEYGAFNEEVTKSFASQILQGLSYLHSKKIIHRDLKSDNILINPDGICKISDFGISKKLEKPRTHTFQGSHQWMAPEVLSNDKAGYDSKVDIWSVGCIVLEMWTAKRPWRDQKFINVIMLLTDKRVPPLPEGLILSESASQFRRECFQLDPDKRPPAHQLLQHRYLTTLPRGWTFPGMSNMGTLNSDTIAEAEEVVNTFSQSLSLGPSEYLNRPISPARTMESGTLATMSTPTPNPPRPISPPLVFIPPPPPRKLPVPQDGESWPSTTRYRSTSNASVASESRDIGRPQRHLALHNPETVPDLTITKKRALPKPPKPPAYSYTPPPLPEVNAPKHSHIPYSNQLGAQLKYADIIPESQHLRQPNNSPSPPSLSLPPKFHRMGPANYKEIMSDRVGVSVESNPTYSGEGSYPSPDYTDSTTSTPSLTTWQRPPPNVVSRSRSRSMPRPNAPSDKVIPSVPPVKRPSLPPTPDQAALPPVIASNARPQSRDVYQHMEVYFRNHNLDEPVVSNAMDVKLQPNRNRNVDPTSSTRSFMMKSIKTIAEEQVRRDRGWFPDKRRQTVLWDSHIEEIKAPNSS